MANDVVKTTETTDEVFRTGNHRLDEATFAEVKPYVYPILKQKAVMTISLIAVAAGAVLFGFDKLIIGILLIAFGILFFLSAATARGRASKKAIMQIRQITGKEFCTYTYAFEEKNLVVRCVETTTTEKIPYDKLVRRTETKSAIVLFTENSSMVIFRKNAMNEQKTEQLFKTLELKCPHMTEFQHKG